METVKSHKGCELAASIFFGKSRVFVLSNYLS